MQKVLAVDNDLLFLDFVRDLLEEAGHLVETAQDGISALYVLETFTPDIIFVDLIMPNIDGERLCRIIRKMEILKNVPIIILSAAAKEESFDAYELGVERIIAKGPLEHMAGNILAVLEKTIKSTPLSPSEHLSVTGDIHPRGITKELLSTKKHFELILERMTEGILEITPDRRIVYANRVACVLIGLPEEDLLGLDFLHLFSLEDRLQIQERLKENLQKRASYTGKEILTLKEYQVIVDLFEIKEDEGKHIVILNNVTERKKLEESIIRSERLAATGQLAASIAHQINSPLQGVTALLSVMKEKWKDDPDLAENIRLLEGAFKNIRNTVRKLLDLNRPGQEEKRSVSIHEIIKDTVALISTHLRQSGIKIHLNLYKESIYLIASPQQLEHVFLNLINNAIEAIAAKGRKATTPHKGVITINTELEKDLLVIEISDSGPGIPEDSLSCVFEPFYTKKGNLGMGIGLTICSAIIEKHEGKIEVRSTAGSGATFKISLPLKP